MILVDFDKIRLDAFREVVSIATSNAATSLSKILDMKVDITIPNIIIEPIEKVPDLLGGSESEIMTVYFKVNGDISGSSILLMFSESESLSLATILTGQETDCIENLDDMGVSALKELGNIVIGAFMTVLANGLKMKIGYSVPGYAYDMVGAILDETLSQLSLETEQAVIMESEFIVREKIYRGSLVFVLPPMAVDNIIQALGNWSK
ncbi:MAG: hypothetical protein DRP56_00205 [Planctomycetota bacterium]|nr:MAG: hypothetical protein DRP56_00205 [Planctomycetota bacterium]